MDTLDFFENFVSIPFWQGGWVYITVTVVLKKLFYLFEAVIIYTIVHAVTLTIRNHYSATLAFKMHFLNQAHNLKRNQSLHKPLWNPKLIWNNLFSFIQRFHQQWQSGLDALNSLSVSDHFNFWLVTNLWQDQSQLVTIRRRLIRPFSYSISKSSLPAGGKHRVMNMVAWLHFERTLYMWE